MLPDVLGYTLEKGEQILKNNGYVHVNRYDIKAPYFKGTQQKERPDQRIVKVKKVSNDMVVVWVCRS